MKELLNELLYWQSEEEKANNKLKEIKGKLEEEFLTEDGYKDENITISYSKPTVSTSIDLKKLEEKEKTLFNELLEDYPKVTERKASYRYTFK